MKSSILVTVLTFVSITSAAQVQLEEIPGGPVVVNGDAVSKYSSEYYRINKKYFGGAQVLGVGPNISNNYGFVFGPYLDRQSILTIEALGGSSILDWETLGSRYTSKTFALGAHYKMFRGNSFYIKGGADLRKFDRTYTYTSLIDGSQDTRWSFSGESIALSLQIGNQWQFDQVSIGCDWIGYSLPIASRIVSENFQIGDEIDRQWMRDDQNDLVKNGHANLLRLYIGASF